MRVAWIAIAFAVCGCARPITTPEHITDWRRVRGVEGCPAFLPHRGADIGIVLNTAFESSLLSQATQKIADRPLCWYETPSGDLLLRAGNFCGLQKEAQFRKQADAWSLVRFEELIGLCH